VTCGEGIVLTLHALQVVDRWILVRRLKQQAVLPLQQEAEGVDQTH
jgi:hypothetical protein